MSTHARVKSNITNLWGLTTGISPRRKLSHAWISKNNSASGPVSISNRSDTTTRSCPFRVLGPLVGCPEEENSFDGGRRIGARDEVEKETESEKKRREKAREDLFLYANKLRREGGKENGTNATCRSRRWRGTRQCCIVALDGLLTQVSECIRTRDTCAYLPPRFFLNISIPCHFLFAIPKSAGDFAYRSLGKCREW